MKKYEEYKLKWLIDHNYTILDLITAIKNVIDDNGDICPEETLEIFEEEYGLNGEIWVSENEWRNNEEIEEKEEKFKSIRERYM